jgi:hypothetical protein
VQARLVSQGDLRSILLFLGGPRAHLTSTKQFRKAVSQRTAMSSVRSADPGRVIVSLDDVSPNNGPEIVPAPEKTSFNNDPEVAPSEDALVQPARDTLQDISLFTHRESVQTYLCDLEASGKLTGKTDAEIIASIAEGMVDQSKAKAMYKKIAFVLIGTIVVLVAAMFGVCVWAAEISKESHVNENAIMTDKQGTPVRTSSGDFKVCEDGSLASTCQNVTKDAKGRRLAEAAGPGSKVIKVISTTQRYPLSSTLSDKFFMALSEVAVFSDKGHTLRLQVHGFARVPVLNSRCGNIVHLYTAWNGRLTLDSGDISFDPETEAHFKNAGFSLAVGGVSGRRLAGSNDVAGFFAAVQDVVGPTWTCGDVPLPSVPETSKQEFTVYRACGVDGTSGSKLDMCDSQFGGVMPGTAHLPRQHQLATMSKTERVKATLSVKVPIEKTLFMASHFEVIKSPSYELQVTTMGNHPGQVKVFIFDRRNTVDRNFQLILNKLSEGRFYCGSSLDGGEGSDKGNTQTKQKQAEQSGIDMKLHFELIDMVEEEGEIYRHFRMMPSRDFMDWMGAKPEADMPKDAYYEYWDRAEDLSPYRLLHPDGSLVVWESMVPGSTENAFHEKTVDARLDGLGRAGWKSMMECTAEEAKQEEVVAPTMELEVPDMASPYMDLRENFFSFYAKLHMSPEKEAEGENGFTTLEKAANGDTQNPALVTFGKYTQKFLNPLAMPDACAEMCANFLGKLVKELSDDSSLEICDAPHFAHLTSCMVHVAGATIKECAQNNFVSVINDCMVDGATGGRRLDEVTHFDEEEDAGGATEAIQQMRSVAREKERRLKEVKEPEISQLKDGTYAMKFDHMNNEQRVALAGTLNVNADSLSSARILFNATTSSNQHGDAVVQGTHSNDPLLTSRGDGEGTASALSRRLQMEMKCIGPNIGWGCIFSFGYPFGCFPWVSDGGYGPGKQFKYGFSIKKQIGGPYNGGLTIGAGGCIEAWSFGVPPPFSGSVCVAGGITVSPRGPCNLPFNINGWVSIKASIGLDLVIISFELAGLELKIGASTEYRSYGCDTRRRRRRWWGHRRRGPTYCKTACDIKIYAKLTLTLWVVRAWLQVNYWVRTKGWDFLIGGDIYIWLIFTSWWENVIKLKIN